MKANPELYRVFCQVARDGSLTKAAENLFITQPAVSQSMKQLESLLDTDLFIRTGRGMVLTEAGRDLLEYTEPAVRLLEQGEQKISERSSLERGEVRVAASDTFCNHFLLKTFAEFHHNYPGIKIRVTNRTSGDSIALLKSGLVDLCFINLPLSDNSLTIKKGPAIHDCFIAGQKFKEMKGRSISLEELSGRPLLLLENQANSRRRLNEFFRMRGLKLKPEIELSSLDLLKEFARVNLGIACVVEEFIDRESEDYFVLKTEIELPERYIGMAVMKDVPLSPAAAVFAELAGF